MENGLKRIEEERNRLIEKRQIAKDKIDRIENQTYRFILIDRYIYANSWLSVAQDIHFSTRRTFQKHAKALEVFERINADFLKDCSKLH